LEIVLHNGLDIELIYTTTTATVEEIHSVGTINKAKVVDREAQRQTRWTRGTSDQEDTDVHESGYSILPTQPHTGPDDFQVTCSIEL